MLRRPFITRFLVEEDDYPDGLYVVVEESDAEPDVGFRGNGKVCISIISVLKADGYGHSTEEDITHQFSEHFLEHIAHKIYEQI